MGHRQPSSKKPRKRTPPSPRASPSSRSAMRGPGTPGTPKTSATCTGSFLTGGSGWTCSGRRSRTRRRSRALSAGPTSARARVGPPGGLYWGSVLRCYSASWRRPSAPCRFGYRTAPGWIIPWWLDARPSRRRQVRYRRVRPRQVRLDFYAERFNRSMSIYLSRLSPVPYLYLLKSCHVLKVTL